MRRFLIVRCGRFQCGGFRIGRLVKDVADCRRVKCSMSFRVGPFGILTKHAETRQPARPSQVSGTSIKPSSWSPGSNPRSKPSE